MLVIFDPLPDLFMVDGSLSPIDEMTRLVRSLGFEATVTVPLLPVPLVGGDTVARVERQGRLPATGQTCLTSLRPGGVGVPAGRVVAGGCAAALDVVASMAR